ncbi:MAG: FixH family protein [Neomegalonema sp.]|nr:FixH family protein [Neomegalonema sp.]
MAPNTPPKGGRPWTGRHVLLVAVAAFGVVIAANMSLVYYATGSFPGLVAKNSYVASQNWTKERAKEAALGWKITMKAAPDALLLIIDGRDGPARGLEVKARIGRPADARTDVDLVFVKTGPGRWRAPALGKGYWRIEAEIADGDGNKVRRAFRRAGPLPKSI